MPFASPTGRRVAGTPQRTPRARFNHRSLTGSLRTSAAAHRHGSLGGGSGGPNMLEPLELVGSSPSYAAPRFSSGGGGGGFQRYDASSDPRIPDARIVDGGVNDSLAYEDEEEEEEYRRDGYEDDEEYPFEEDEEEDGGVGGGGDEGEEEEHQRRSAAMAAAMRDSLVAGESYREAMASFLPPLGGGLRDTPSPSGSERVMRGVPGGGREAAAVRRSGGGGGVSSNSGGGGIGGGGAGASSRAGGGSGGVMSVSPPRRSLMMDEFQAMRSRHRAYLDEVGMAMNAMGDGAAGGLGGGGGGDDDILLDDDLLEDEVGLYSC
jgi:hypothetical protein